MTRLMIIRHGEAVCNVADIVGGRAGCQGLTERGQAQVQRLAERLHAEQVPADVLYASPLRRAQETALVVGEVLGLPVRWEDDFEEIRPGEADGLPGSVARERYLRADRDPLYDPFSPGGESIVQFFGRVGAALARVIRRHAGQRVVIVAHGGIIEASFYYFLPLAPATVRSAGLVIDHTSITEWRQGDPADRRWYLARFNDTAHLAGAPQAATEAA